LQYPASPRVDHVDVYHGVSVPDPYRWLEEPDSAQTRAWIDAQNAVTERYLGTIASRETLRQRLETLWDYERWGVPTRHGDRYVVDHNDGLQDQSVLYTLDRLDAEPRLLLDPNTLSKDGTIALTETVFSEDGRYMAYGLSASGSDWQVWHVRDVLTATDTEDELRWIKFSSASWTKDGRGFYYGRYDEPKEGAELEALNYDQKLYYHRLGTPQTSDRLVYARPDQREWSFEGQVSDDGRYLVITVDVGTDPKTSIFFQHLSGGSETNVPTVELLPGFQARYTFVGNEGPVFWFLTDDEAPRGRLIAIDTRKPDRSQWRELIPEQRETLERVNVVGDRFVTAYLNDAHTQVRVFALDGTPEREIELPGIGTSWGFEGERDHIETFYGYTSFGRPSTIYRYDFASGRSEVFRAPEVAFDPADFETSQVFYTSADGTRIPMFLTYKKGLVRDGQNPTYLYGYGGFNISLTPSFTVPNLVWMELGGILAVPNLRGGGEYGESWHQAGIKVHKQNVFDDFVAAAEWLIAEKYTRPQSLAIGGRSNGGLLVGAAMTQRPELFAAALPGVGVMDMMRFNQFTIGWAWESDYGSPANPDEFAALLAYSPYHNLREGTPYPATLVYTADHDDRVVPAHSFKFAAALQWAHRGNTPVLIRIDTKAGHGRGKPVAKQIEEWADLWGFLLENVASPPSMAPG